MPLIRCGEALCTVCEEGGGRKSHVLSLFSPCTASPLSIWMRMQRYWRAGRWQLPLWGSHELCVFWKRDHNRKTRHEICKSRHMLRLRDVSTFRKRAQFCPSAGSRDLAGRATFQGHFQKTNTRVLDIRVVHIFCLKGNNGCKSQLKEWYNVRENM